MTSRRSTWPVWIPRLGEVRLRIACDVTNPLLGPDGAAAVYGPQKGATPELVATLDARLAGFADALEAATGRRERDTPGAGAAGGLGFGLLCLRGLVRARCGWSRGSTSSWRRPASTVPSRPRTS